MQTLFAVGRTSLLVLVLTFAVPDLARADVALPTIAIAFGSPLWLFGGLAAVVAIESLVLWASAAASGLLLGQAIGVASVANVISTLIGIPMAWFGLALMFGMFGGTTGHDITTRSGRISDAVWYAPWIVPHEYVDWDAYQGEWDWILPAKVLVLLLPFFLVTWLIEHAVATRMAAAFSEPVGVGVLIGNVLTYGLMALVAAWFLVSDLRRAAPIIARTRAVDEQRRELRRLRSRARSAYRAGDLPTLHDILEILSGLRPNLLEEELSTLAGHTWELCGECIERLCARTTAQVELPRSQSGVSHHVHSGDYTKAA